MSEKERRCPKCGHKVERNGLGGIDVEGYIFGFHLDAIAELNRQIAGDGTADHFYDWQDILEYFYKNPVVMDAPKPKFTTRNYRKKDQVD